MLKKMAQPPPRIMLVTENEDRRLRLQRVFARAGYRLDSVLSRREALHVLTQASRAPDGIDIDLILVDQQSLGAHAHTLIHTVFNAELMIPMVVLSTFDVSDDTISCLRAGATDYISLPAEAREILDVLSRALSPSLIV